MIEIKLNEVLEKEDRNLNWVYKKTGISYSTLHKLANNNTKSISFDVLDKLCDLFNCELQEIIDHKKK